MCPSADNAGLIERGEIYSLVFVMKYGEICKVHIFIFFLFIRKGSHSAIGLLKPLGLSGMGSFKLPMRYQISARLPPLD